MGRVCNSAEGLGEPAPTENGPLGKFLRTTKIAL